LMLATAHVPIADVPRLVTPQLLDQKLRLLLATLPRDFGYSKERVRGPGGGGRGMGPARAWGAPASGRRRVGGAVGQ
jgi:hypothetical protein